MAIKETDVQEQYAFVPSNYLYDWCRRTGNIGNIANYYVEPFIPANGQPMFRVRDIADLVPSRGGTYGGVSVLAQNHVSGGALTGTTSATTLASILIPGGLMGLNGALRITAQASITNNANTKTLAFVLGGSQLLSANATTAAGLALNVIAANRNSFSSQIAHLFGTGGASPENTTAINTAVDQILTISGTLAVGTDSLTLDSYVIEVLPG